MRKVLGLVGVLACFAAIVPLAAQETKEKDKGPALRREGLGGYNLVDVRTTVVACRHEGERVARGDVVCELDATELTDRLVVHDRVVEAAEAELRAARAAREAAEGAVVGFNDGTYRQSMEMAQGEVALAESNLKRAEDRLEWSDKMLAKGYLTVEETISERQKLQHAKFALEQAFTRKKVLEAYSKESTLKGLKAQVEAARAAELSRVAALASAEADRKAWKAQLAHSKVVAPAAGRVRFAPGVEPGAPVAEGQLLFHIDPDGPQGGPIVPGRGSAPGQVN
jgi:multidrug resistance efflux pump